MKNLIGSYKRKYVSILVFMEEALEEFEASLFKFRLKFQSLFSWKRHWKLHPNISARFSQPVSILVFMEEALEDTGTRYSHSPMNVSILVFMEEALEG